MNIAIPLPNQELVFRLYPIDTKFNRISGIYTFFIIPPNSPFIETTEKKESPFINDLQEKESPFINEIEKKESPSFGGARGGYYNLLYIGIATNLYSRLKSHHKIAQAITLGMTHIGILKMSSGRKRKTTEKNVLKEYNPALNQTWL